MYSRKYESDGCSKGALYAVVILQSLILIGILCFSNEIHPQSYFSVRDQKLTNRPIIGILTQPNEYPYPTGKTGYLSASYVKWIESSGARVVVVPYDAPNSELRRLFAGVNGLVFPGGGQSLLPNTKFYQASAFLYDLALEATNRGDYFPIWGTCMGFQLLALITANNQSVLSRNAFDSENLSIPIEFIQDSGKSRMFGPSCPSNVREIFAKEDVTINLHHDGILTPVFHGNPKLSEFYRLIAVNVDRKNKQFISVIEAYEYPIYAIQFHPERNSFEWDEVESVSHTANAILAMQYLGDFFVNECRRNYHTFPSERKAVDHMIYNYNPIYTGWDPSGFPDQQTYFFDPFPRSS